MFRTDVIIIGGGQAGLAMSAELSASGIDHVVLERGQVAQRWASERWDSVQLLTPNWMTRLPGHVYAGPDPDGFMSKQGVVEMLRRYSLKINAPLFCDTSVVRVSAWANGYRVTTSRGDFMARAVVIATGYCDRANVPSFAANLPDRIAQFTPSDYRKPANLAKGGVVIVGASATGLQLAEEIQASGREVTLCVGRHTRMPRRYHDRDIMAWLDSSGMLDQKWTEVPDISAARRQPSLQLVGRDDRRDLDLNSLAQSGVRITGRAIDASTTGLRVATDLSLNCERTNQKLTSVLNRIDRMIGSADTHPDPINLSSDCTSIDFKGDRIETIIWATGFKRDYSWLDVPVLDERDEITHDGGITSAPGLCAMGLQFMRRRKSSFIDGVGADAADLSDYLNLFLNAEAKRFA